MATRRRLTNPTGESPAGSVERRGEEFDVEVSGFLSDQRIFTVMEQTVQIVKYHPVTSRIGMEATIRDGLTEAEVDACFAHLENRVGKRLRTVIRDKLETGLEVLEDLGRKPIY